MPDATGAIGAKMTAQEVAEELGYHLDHVYRLLRAGKIRGEQFNRVWLIDHREVERIKAMQDEHGRLS
jgi:excisionase family DNA binding protein